MTVSSQTNKETFNGNGTTTVWDLPFRFFDDADVFAYQINPAAGTVTPLALGTDYTLTGAELPEQFGVAQSKITTLAPIPINQQLYVERQMALEQLTDILNQGQFFPEIHENAFDRLTMLMQQVNASNAGAIRVALTDPTPTRLPIAALRANLLMGFDSLGNPIPLAPTTDSAAGLALMLANSAAVSQGAAMIGRGGQVVKSIAELRTLLAGSPSKHAFATGYTTQGDGGGGPYYQDAADVTSVDNGGTVIVAADGMRWKLAHNGVVTVKQFGVKADNGATNNNATLIKARDWVASNPIRNHLVFTPGQYGYSVSPNWAIQDSHVSFEGDVQLIYSGTAHAVIFDAGPNAPDLCYNVTWGWGNRPIIKASAAALNAYYVRSVHHAKIGGIVRGAGVASAGLHVQFAVCTQFDITTSVNEEGWYLGAKPAVGLKLDRRLGNEQTSYCLFSCPIIEGPDVGIYLVHTLGNVFLGGTSEACSQYGVFAEADASGDRFIGTDFEANGIADVYSLGAGLEIISCDSDKLITFGTTATLCRVQGGRHKSILVDVGSAGCSVNDLVFNRSNNGGTIADFGSNSIIRGCRNGGTNALYLTGSKVYDPPLIATGAIAQTTVTVSGAIVGDKAIASFTLSIQALVMNATVSAVDTVTVTFLNLSGAPIDLASGTLACNVIRGA